MIPRVPWPRIRQRYLSDLSTTFRSLGVEFGVNWRTIASHASKEKWTELRQQTEEAISNEVIRIASIVAAEEAAVTIRSVVQELREARQNALQALNRQLAVDGELPKSEHVTQKTSGTDDGVRILSRKRRKSWMTAHVLAAILDAELKWWERIGLKPPKDDDKPEAL